MFKCSVNMILHIYKVTAVIFLLKSFTVCPWVAIESCKTITVNHCRIGRKYSDLSTLNKLKELQENGLMIMKVSIAT